MSPRFVLGRENVPCVAEVVNRSLKADCTDFTFGRFVAMVTKDLQTLNLKFDQVMFNGLVLTWERNFEVTDVWYFLSPSVPNKCSWKLFRYLSVLKLVMFKNVKIVIILAFKSKFYQYFVFTKKLLCRFVSFCISLIFRYCLFLRTKKVTIKHFFLNFFGGSKCVTKWQFLPIFWK